MSFKMPFIANLHSKSGVGLSSGSHSSKYGTQEDIVGTPDLEPSQTEVATLRTQCWCSASEVGGSLVALNPHGLLLSELN